MKKLSIILFLLLCLFLSIGLINFGRSEKDEPQIEYTPTPTPTATPSATPVVRQNRTPERVIITQPQAGGSAQPQAQPAPAPVTNNNTTVVQPAPQPTQAPQQTSQPGTIDNVIDSVRKIL